MEEDRTYADVNLEKCQTADCDVLGIVLDPESTGRQWAHLSDLLQHLPVIDSRATSTARWTSHSS